MTDYIMIHCSAVKSITIQINIMYIHVVSVGYVTSTVQFQLRPTEV